MKDLGIAQEYTLCALDKVVKQKALLFQYKYAACIAAAIFWELIMRDAIRADENKKIVINKELNSDDEYLKVIYDSIAAGKAKTFKKWIEDYILSFSSKPIKQVIECVVQSLVSEGCLQLENKKGILKEQVICHTEKQQVDTIIEKIRAEFLEDGSLTDETVVLTALMLKSDVLKNYFSKHEEDKFKARIKEIKNSAAWSSVKEVLDEIDIIIIAASVSGSF